MRDGWEIKKLGELVNIKTGKLDSNAMVEGGKYPFFTCSREIFAIDEYAFDCEAILLAGNNASGDFNVKYYKGKFNAYQRTYVITVNENNRILYSYLNQQLINHLKIFKEQSLGANTKFLKIGMIQGMEIPLPPLPEQQRIVSILDEAFAAIARAKANAEQNLRNAKELFESYLQGVFEGKGDGWEEKRLAEVAKHSLGKMLDKNKNKGILQKYLRNQSVRWFEFDLSDLTEMPFLETEREKYTAEKGDVLICEGGYPGRAAIWQEDYPIYFQKAIHRVRFNKPVYNKLFLYHLYLSDKTGKLKEYFSGTGIQHFTGEALAKYLIPLPPPNKTEAIVQKLDALSAETKKLETIYQQKINDLEEMKKSILQKAFSGEL